MKAQDFKIGDVLELTFVNSGIVSVWKVTVITEKGIQVKRHTEGSFNIKSDLRYIRFKDVNYYKRISIKHIFDYDSFRKSVLDKLITG